MKYVIAVTILLGAVLVVPLTAQNEHASGFAMSLKPGMYLTAAHFGYYSAKTFFGIGLEVASISVKSTYTYGTSTNTANVGATILLPELAGKIFLSDALSEDTGIRPYIWLSAFYTIGMASMTSNGQHNDEAEKSMEDLLSGNIGGLIGFGSEYFFSPQFSIGGEFGLRLMFGGTETEYSYGKYTSTVKDNLGLGLTYTSLGLNFYF
jgi:hypothetical protein